MKKVLAPKITASELWNKTPDEFNLWRKKYDYPRIIKYLKNDLTNFTKWMEEEKITDNDFLDFGISIFIKPKQIIMIYKLKDKAENIIFEIREPKHTVGEIIFHDKTVLSRKDIVPYFTWAKKDKECIADRVEMLFFINSRTGRQIYINSNLELLDIGNIELPKNFQLSGRNLEFLNLDDLTLNKCWNNSHLKLWYSSAINLTVNGDLAFVDIYKTSLTQVGAVRINSLKLNNGTFQDWKIENSESSLISKNSKLHKWNVSENSFNITLINSDIQDCVFKEGTINYNKDYYSASQLHRNMKRVYSHIGQQSNAGKHFYKEKLFEQKALMFTPKSYLEYSPFKNETKNKKKFLFILHHIKSYSKSVSLLFQKYLWGFGEKPARVFGLSILVIILSSLVYYFDSKSITVENAINSTYFSIVTFTTLGYGDISQKDNFLKLFSSFESFIGLSLMGLVIAGFASKSKDY